MTHQINKDILKKFSEFFVSRFLGTGVDTAVLWVCGQYFFKGYWGQYWLSPLISFELATFVNFLTSYFWIWRSRINEDKGKRSFSYLFVFFNVACIAGFIIKMIFLLLFESIFGFSAVICNLLALCISGIFNFILSESVIFRKKYPEPEHPLLSIEEFTNSGAFFSSSWGYLIGRFLMDATGLSRLNRLYDKVSSYRGTECAHKTLELMGCRYEIVNSHRLDSLPEGAFITISNHPYGALDGLILTDMIGGRRSDYSIMVNSILARAKSMEGTFITVIPTTTEKKAADSTTLKGIRNVIIHLKQGHPLGIFPSGAISDFKFKTNSLRDREWQPSILKLIQRAAVPIVPIFFPDRNSRFFYFLGLLSWKIRLLRLPQEFFNKNTKIHHVVIGETISVEEQAKYSDLSTFGKFLRESVYGKKGEY